MASAGSTSQCGMIGYYHIYVCRYLDTLSTSKFKVCEQVHWCFFDRRLGSSPVQLYYLCMTLQIRVNNVDMKMSLTTTLHAHIQQSRFSSC